MNRGAARDGPRPAEFHQADLQELFSSLFLRKTVRSPAFRPQALDTDPFRYTKRFRLKAGLRTVSIDRVAHHLTAARPRRPTADHRRKFSRGSARHDDLDLIRPREFAVTLFAIDRRALVKLSELRSLAAIIFIFLDRNARILEQKLTDRIFGEAAAIERLHVLGAKGNHRLPCETEAVGEDRRQRAADGLQDRAALARVMVAASVRRLRGEDRPRARVAGRTEAGGW